MKFKYDPTATLSYGQLECPDCKVRYYGNGPQACQCTGEQTYHFTPAEKAKMERGEHPPFAPQGCLKAFLNAV